MGVREPVLTTVAIDDLRPTQITVGMREVQAKRKRWRDTGTKKGEEFLGKHMIPVILGPKERHYVIDHHHLARALHDEKVKQIAVTVVSNLSVLDLDAFWTVMDNRSWMHPFDAGELRRAGGYAKDTTPFSEFLWADFMRRRMKRKLVERDFDRAVEKALQLAKSPEANYLPGWCGPSPED
jgi:hypothetical protein